MPLWKKNTNMGGGDNNNGGGNESGNDDPSGCVGDPCQNNYHYNRWGRHDPQGTQEYIEDVVIGNEFPQEKLPNTDQPDGGERGKKKK
jgi:hypothetical protein